MCWLSCSTGNCNKAYHMSCISSCQFGSALQAKCFTLRLPLLHVPNRRPIQLRLPNPSHAGDDSPPHCSTLLRCIDQQPTPWHSWSKPAAGHSSGCAHWRVCQHGPGYKHHGHTATEQQARCAGAAAGWAVEAVCPAVTAATACPQHCSGPQVAYMTRNVLNHFVLLFSKALWQGRSQLIRLASTDLSHGAFTRAETPLNLGALKTAPRLGPSTGEAYDTQTLLWQSSVSRLCCCHGIVTFSRNSHKKALFQTHSVL